MTDMLKERLTKAEHSAGVAVDELRDALKNGGELEHIILYDLIAQAANLHIKIKQLRAAIVENRIEK